MNPRPLIVCLAFAMATAACDNGAPAPVAVANDASPSTFDNASAATSIIRPAVANEVTPEPEPTPTPEPLEATIIFDRGSMLDEAARSALDALIASPGFGTAGSITLAGHSDSPGGDAANLQTSRRRAVAVRDYLIGKGVDPDRITVVALGESNPIAPNALPDGSDNPEGRRRNRRVDVTVAPPGQPPAPSPTPSETPEEEAAARDG